MYSLCYDKNYFIGEKSMLTQTYGDLKLPERWRLQLKERQLKSDTILSKNISTLHSIFCHCHKNTLFQVCVINSVTCLCPCRFSSVSSLCCQPKSDSRPSFTLEVVRAPSGLFIGLASVHLCPPANKTISFYFCGGLRHPFSSPLWHKVGSHLVCFLCS